MAEISTRAGGFPCGALVVRDGLIVGEGGSRGRTVADPTAHAEVEAIRMAAVDGGRDVLEGATLYSAMEPCLMCLHAAYWSGIGRMVHGARKNLFRSEYYEGGGSLAVSVQSLNRKMMVEFLPGFEERIVVMVRRWEDSLGRAQD